ncbi:hypothetical protein C9J48_14765 [Photobacterium profundum]|uniref:DUF6279 family lipoprotein n=1 Tax=Photobacterium profundum TaxID=74109 RepID=UPI000322B943|nr:DUF6279 family lipoprotein [Photobacterium profundum]PSV61519.1 hypothetical protein C9J48_14765 [Photobacterium profundum]
MTKNGTRWVCCSLIIVLLTGCTLRLGYNTLNFWVTYYLADYVSLNSTQERAFERNLDIALVIHRTKELPKFHRLIDELQADLAKPLSFNQIRGYYLKFTEAGKESTSVFSKPFAAMIQSLSASQINELNQNIEKKIEQVIAKRKRLSPKEKMVIRRDKLQDAARGWIGSLSNKQKAILLELTEYQVEMEPIFFSIWRDFLRDWQELMKNRNKPDFEPKLNVLLQQLIAFENARVQPDINVYLARRFDVLRRLNHTLSGKQTRYLNRKLVDMRKDIAMLINEK